MDSRAIKLALFSTPGFMGVYSRDTLPILDRNFVKSYCKRENARYLSLVVNTDFLRGKGIHWVCILVNKSGRIAYYFDSLGGMPQIPEIVSFCSQFDTCYYNKYGHQRERSRCCGAYACFAIRKMNENWTFRKVVYLFEELIENDDEYVTSWLSREHGIELIQ